MARKSTKICLVCGNEFKGTAAAFTCSGACRTAMSRILADGKKPEYWLVAKTKGQKLPLIFSKPSPKPKVEWKAENIQFIASKEAHYDGGSHKPYLQDEVGLMPPPPPELTKEQKLVQIAELTVEMNKVKNQSCPSNQHPKTFKLMQEMKISEFQELIQSLQQQLKL